MTAPELKHRCSECAMWKAMLIMAVADNVLDWGWTKKLPALPTEEIEAFVRKMLAGGAETSESAKEAFDVNRN